MTVAGHEQQRIDTMFAKAGMPTGNNNAIAECATTCRRRRNHRGSLQCSPPQMSR